MGDFNPHSNRQRDNSAGHRQFGRFLECSGNNFLRQMIEVSKGENTLVVLIPMHIEKLIRGVKDEGSTGYGEHDMVEFKVLREERRAKSRIIKLNSGQQSLAS